MSELVFLFSYPSSMCFCANSGNVLSIDGKSNRRSFAKITLCNGNEDQEKT